MLLEPYGFRWLRETWLKVDMGVEFYNTQPMHVDAAVCAESLGVCARADCWPWWRRRGILRTRSCAVRQGAMRRGKIGGRGAGR